MSTIDPNYAIPGFKASAPTGKTGNASCRDCDLVADERCFDAPCLPWHRPDKQTVIMKAIEPSEVTK